MHLTDLPALQSLVEHTFDAIIVTEASLDRPGPKIVYANTAACELTGYSRTEIIGERPRLFQGPLTERTGLEALRNHLEAAKVFEASTTNYRKNGTPNSFTGALGPSRAMTARRVPTSPFSMTNLGISRRTRSPGR